MGNVQWASFEDNFRDAIEIALLEPDWNEIPSVQLEDAFNRCVDSLSAQEICNSIYGFAILDAAWNELSINTKTTIVQALRRNENSLDHQEVANVMYSLSLLTFDVEDPNYKINGGENWEESVDLMWEVHEIVLKFYCTLDPAEYHKENYDQFAMYFEMMSINPKGVELMNRVLTNVEPCFSGPAGTI